MTNNTAYVFAKQGKEGKKTYFLYYGSAHHEGNFLLVEARLEAVAMRLKQEGIEKKLTEGDAHKLSGNVPIFDIPDIYSDASFTNLDESEKGKLLGLLEPNIGIIPMGARLDDRKLAVCFELAVEQVFHHYIEKIASVRGFIAINPEFKISVYERTHKEFQKPGESGYVGYDIFLVYDTGIEHYAKHFEKRVNNILGRQEKTKRTSFISK